MLGPKPIERSPGAPAPYRRQTLLGAPACPGRWDRGRAPKEGPPGPPQAKPRAAPPDENSSIMGRSV